MCGTMRPMKPMSPEKATAAAVVESGDDHQVPAGALAVDAQLARAFLAHEQQVHAARREHHVDEARADHGQGDVDLGPSGGGEAAHQPDDHRVQVALGGHHEKRHDRR